MHLPGSQNGERRRVAVPLEYTTAAPVARASVGAALARSATLWPASVRDGVDRRAMGAMQPDRGLGGGERLAIAAFFLVAIAVSAVVVSRLGEPPGDVIAPIEERPVASPDIPRPVPLLDAYRLAASWAGEWHDTAELILVSMQVEYPREAPIATPSAAEASEGFYLFTFAGPKEDGAWPRLTLAVGRQSGVIYHEGVMTSTVEPPDAIDDLLVGLPIPAEQAFAVADRVVGAGYREGCVDTRRQVQVALDATDREQPAWVVVYYDTRERNVNDIVVRIDAETGETRTETRDDTSCELPVG